MRADRPDPGTFPFPLPDGSEESPYLTWIRNRSNYMAVRGLFDYSRAIGILLRGIAVNFLIFVPYLLLVSLAVAATRFHRQPESTRATRLRPLGPSRPTAATAPGVPMGWAGRPSELASARATAAGTETPPTVRPPSLAPSTSPAS